MASHLRLLALVFALSCSTGCFYVGASGAFGPVLREETVARIVPGETTKREVLALLGPPEEFLRTEVLDALNDEITRVTRAIALGNRAQDAFTWQFDTLGGAGTFLVLYNRIRIDAESELLVVFFDEQDRVREVSLRKIPKEAH